MDSRDRWLEVRRRQDDAIRRINAGDQTGWSDLQAVAGPLLMGRIFYGDQISAWDDELRAELGRPLTNLGDGVFPDDPADDDLGGEY